MQVDWRAFQANHRDEWLACLKKTFHALDKDGTGRVGIDDITALLQDKLPENEVGGRGIGGGHWQEGGGAVAELTCLA